MASDFGDSFAGSGRSSTSLERRVVAFPQKKSKENMLVDLSFSKKTQEENLRRRVYRVVFVFVDRGCVLIDRVSFVAFEV